MNTNMTTGWQQVWLRQLGAYVYGPSVMHMRDIQYVLILLFMLVSVLSIDRPHCLLLTLGPTAPAIGYTYVSSDL